MKLSQVKRYIKSLPPASPVFIWGMPGIGKSSIVMEIAEEEKAPVEVVIGSLCAPEDIQGLPFRDKVSKCVKWYPQYWWSRFCNEDAVGTIFLDELPSAEPSVQVAMQRAILERQVGEHKLGPKVRVIAAGNRREDAALVTALPGPLRNRFHHIDVEPDLDDWITNYAIPSGIDPTIVAFLRFRGVGKDQLFARFDAKTDDKAYPTPRSWVMANRVLSVCPHDLLHEALAGTVGEGATTQFWAFRQLEKELPSIDLILEDPDGAPLPGNPNLQHAIIGLLFGRLQKRRLSKVVDAVFRYAHRLPPEFAMKLTTDLVACKGTMSTALRKSTEFAVMAKKLGKYTGLDG